MYHPAQRFRHVHQSLYIKINNDNVMKDIKVMIVVIQGLPLAMVIDLDLILKEGVFKYKKLSKMN